MGNLVNKTTGEREYIDDADMPAALASNKYNAPSVVAATRFGEDTYVTPDIQKQEASVTPLSTGAKAEIQRGETQRRQENTGLLAEGKSLLGAGLDSASFGVINPWEDAQEFNRGAAVVGSIGGAVLPGLLGDESGFLSLARDPVAAEHAAGALSSKLLYAGEVGGEAGSAAKLAEKGLVRGKAVLDESAQAAADLGSLDAKGLRGARDAEVEAIKTGRAPQQQQLVEDVAAHREALGDEKIWLATKDADAKAIGNVKEIGKIQRDADFAITKQLNNPKAMAANLNRILEPLQRQEHALEMLDQQAPALRQAFAADETGVRAAALDKIPVALERNRSLQAKIAELTSAPASAKLDAIQAAQDALSAPKAPKSFLEDMLGGSIMGHVSGALSGLPIIGPAIGAKAGKVVSDLVFGRMGGAVGAGMERTGKAISSFVSVAKRSPALPVLATKALASTQFAPEPNPSNPAPQPKDLAGLFKQRSAEIRSQTAYDETGTSKMRPEARQAMADRLSPIRAFTPLLADQLETMGAKRIEFLASKLPKFPDLPVVPGGPDKRKPSDMAMRTFARYVAAANDPHGVEERLAAGTVTPEDAETYRALYPERFAALQQSINEKLPSLRAALPYQKRIALSIFSGVAVDPAMSPNILAVLQGGFAAEPGSEGGTQAPKAQPQFGSVSKSIEKPTPAQGRS